MTSDTLQYSNVSVAQVPELKDSNIPAHFYKWPLYHPRTCVPIGVTSPIHLCVTSPIQFPDSSASSISLTSPFAAFDALHLDDTTLSDAGHGDTANDTKDADSNSSLSPTAALNALVSDDEPDSDVLSNSSSSGSGSVIWNLLGLNVNGLQLILNTFLTLIAIWITNTSHCMLYIRHISYYASMISLHCAIANC